MLEVKRRVSKLFPLNVTFRVYFGSLINPADFTLENQSEENEAIWWASMVPKSCSDNEYLSSQERAAALWKAGCIARYEGMELLGTEVEPDWFVYSGHFERMPASDVRGLPGSAELLASTADERRRLQQNVVPEKRFHYRYEASEHAWRAAELMPDQSDQTTRVLCIAGSWLKALRSKRKYCCNICFSK